MANGVKGKGRSQNQRLKLLYLLKYIFVRFLQELCIASIQNTIKIFKEYVFCDTDGNQMRSKCGREVFLKMKKSLDTNGFQGL